MPYARLFDQIHNLPTIPKVVQELIDNFNNKKIDAEKISRNIQKDQAIALKVMRLANSARYGAGRKIASIDSAVVMLGFDTLKTLVIASGLTGTFKDIPGMDKKTFWRESFSVANVSKLIAKFAKLETDVAFTCGMLHNIGETLMYLGHPQEMPRIDKLVSDGAKRHELEKDQFGYDYTDVGFGLTKRWNFPDVIQQALQHQANPLAAQPFSPYAAVLYLASYLNRCFMKEKSKEDILSQFPHDVAKSINIDLLTFFEVLVDLYEKEDDIELLLS
ncbi:MAG: HDOD domain-containing protein [Hahellaceae bacterium]|nr:HDOD domain-containing protein [Hahellaceae bacterium]